MIGIINYYNADNYGAVLQCYALQQVLADLGQDSEVINYKCPYIEKHYSLIHFNDLKQFVSDICYFKNRWLLKRKFQDFRRRLLKISDTVYDVKNINEANKRYDRFITGSDQVFNYTNTNFDKSFFLDFVKNDKMKFSYAASFGVSDIPSSLINEYRYLLKRFNRVSFRENTGVKIYKDLTGKNAKLTLDPVLIAPMRCWDLIDTQREDNYILVYMLERSKELIEFVKKLKKDTSYKVIYIGSLVKFHRQGLSADFRGDLSPYDFVGLFKHATYVVTNSFHGTAFSILFKKNFYVEKLKNKTETNDRFISLLSQLDLTQCIIDFSKNENIKLEEKINYNIVYNKLKKIKDQSIDYLQMICKEI